MSGAWQLCGSGNYKIYNNSRVVMMVVWVVSGVVSLCSIGQHLICVSLSVSISTHLSISCPKCHISFKFPAWWRTDNYWNEVGGCCISDGDQDMARVQWGNTVQWGDSRQWPMRDSRAVEQDIMNMWCGHMRNSIHCLSLGINFEMWKMFPVSDH